jgi:TetR/AcrR family transcriptional regulator, cholesterol catabolism regulator
VLAQPESKEPRNAREKELLEQALKLFSQDGYQDTSLQGIADALGVTRPLFYYYFKSKEDLLWRLIGHLGDALLTRARPLATSDRPPVERLRKLLEGHAETLFANHEAFRVYFEQRHHLKRDGDEMKMRQEAAYIGLIAGVIAEGQIGGYFRQGDPRVLALLVTGLANSTLRWYSPSGAIKAAELSELTAEIAVSGILSGEERYE